MLGPCYRSSDACLLSLPQVPPEIKQLKADVEKLASQFPTIGFEKSTMKYQD